MPQIHRLIPINCKSISRPSERFIQAGKARKENTRNVRKVSLLAIKKDTNQWDRISGFL
jgi:hypothetical protein